jgi:hypothetical protein
MHLLFQVALIIHTKMDITLFTVMWQFPFNLKSHQMILLGKILNCITFYVHLMIYLKKKLLLISKITSRTRIKKIRQANAQWKC